MTTAVKAPKEKSYSFSLTIRRILVYIALAIIAFLCLFFLYVLYINATRSHGEIQTSVSFLPGSAFLKNWDSLMNTSELPIWNGMLNSLIISASVAACSTYFSALTAYAIHIYDFKLKNAAFNFILLIMMVPPQVSALGLVKLAGGWGMINTFWPLILPKIAVPLVFFFMKQYMDSSLPVAIVEAARIDGSGEFHTFNHVVMPIMKPAMAVQAIFTFVEAWNNYFIPALILRSRSVKTLPILIAELRGSDWLKFDMGQVYMMIALSILPVIIVYLCLSRFIIRGVSLGSVKG